MRYITDATSLTAALTQYHSDQPPVVAVDTETTGLSPHSDKVRLVQISWGKAPERVSLVVDAFCVPLEPLKEILESPTVIKLFYNAKFDINMLRGAGIQVVEPVQDLMLMFGVLINGEIPRYNLAVAYNTIMNPETPMSSAKKKKLQTSEWTQTILSPEQLEYASHDAEILLDMFPVLKNAVLKSDLSYVVDKIEHPAMWAAADMEFNGIPVDMEVFSRMKATLEPEVAAAKQRIEDIFSQVGVTEINLNSPTQLIKALAAAGVEVESTGEDILKEIDHPVIEALLEYKKKTKLMQFVTKLPTHVDPETHRIHCSFNMLGAVTGRTSCLQPNLQQIPRSPELRDFIRAKPGHKIVVADYAQIELVIAAEISGDPTLVAAYNAGKDVHKITASLILNKPIEQVTKQERQLAKAVNFG